MSYHALFSPSSAFRWIRCPASLMYNLPSLKGYYPEPESCKAADIGAYLHTLAFNRYNGNPESVNGKTIDTTDPKVKSKLERIQGYIDFLRDISKKDKTETVFLSDIKIEQHILDPIYPGHLSGTPDFFRVDLTSNNDHKIWIVDLKTGNPPKKKTGDNPPVGIDTTPGPDESHRAQLTVYAELLIRYYSRELRRRDLNILEEPRFTVYQHVYYVSRARNPLVSWTQTFTSASIASCQFKYTAAVAEYSDYIERKAFCELPFETGNHCIWCPGSRSGCPVFAAHMHAIGEECEKPDPSLCAERAEFLDEVARMAWGRLKSRDRAMKALDLLSSIDN